MDSHEDALLQYRLKNCLQTILDLEEKLSKTHLGPMLLNEFAILKRVFEKLDAVTVDEADVKRIEEATDRFLSELRDTMPDSSLDNDNSRILH